MASSSSKGTSVQFSKTENFQRPLAQQCAYSYHHYTVYLKLIKTVNFMLCIFTTLKKEENNKHATLSPMF